MIERNELENLYNNELKDKLQGLEGLRKKVKNGQILGILLLVLTVILFGPVSAALEQSSEALPFIVLAPVAIFGIVILIRTYKKRINYRDRFKNEVVREIVKAIDPTWEYDPNQCIASNEYHSSDLFRKSVDRYKGDDLICGKIDKTDFRCSELHT
ncbi:MAG TPA: hypothetical protein PLV65_04380, partial [Tenuifilaceae bacterium]|nr:hypothetical protein [Tenuifilaceae bacterium]